MSIWKSVTNYVGSANISRAVMDTLEREQNKQKESNKSESIQYNMQLTGSDPRPNQYATVLRFKFQMQLYTDSLL